MNALIDRQSREDSPFRIVAALGDREAPGFEFARAAGIMVGVVRPEDYDNREAWGAAFAHRLDVFGMTDEGLIVGAGFMRILPVSVVQAFSPRIINTHPALLPSFPGTHAVRDAIAAGVSTTGTTIHIVDEGVDTGPIIAQRECEILPDDTEPRLHSRIKSLERPLLVETVERIANGELSLDDYARRS